MTSKDIINNVIFNLKKHCVDNFVDLTEDIDNFEIVLKDLERKEELEKENQELKDKIKELEVLNENLNKYIDNFRQNANIQNLYDNQEIYKLKQAIDILKTYICISKRRNEVNGNYDICCIYSFGSYKDITEGKYELLKEVLDNE